MFLTVIFTFARTSGAALIIVAKESLTEKCMRALVALECEESFGVPDITRMETNYCRHIRNYGRAGLSA